MVDLSGTATAPRSVARDTSKVVLLADDGHPIGVGDKAAVHQPPGLLHAAISVVVVNPAGEILLQRRAAEKPLFAGLWSNSCCTHPAPGESVRAAAERRLQEELGLTVTDLHVAGSFRYRATDPRTGLVEAEHDTVLVARSAHQPQPDPHEVGDWEWVPADARDVGRPVTPWAPRVHALAGPVARIPPRTVPTQELRNVD